MGAGIMIIVQYGYNGDSFDFEVKAGGQFGLSAQVAMKNPSIDSIREIELVRASTSYSESRLGLAVKLSYKFGGLTASFSGSGSATGYAAFGASQEASSALGMVYAYKGYWSGGATFTPIHTSSNKNTAPYMTSTSLKTTSLSAALELTAVENFKISYSYISISFDASVSATMSYSLGSTGYASVTVFSDTWRRVLPANTLKNEQESPSEDQHFNFLPGDVTLILFEYSGFNPSEEIILFYSVQKSDAGYPIMQKNFTTSESGSGTFEGSWTVPWDYVLAGVGTNDTVISVRATNSISKTFSSESFGLSVFTDSDGIFSAPSASEVILINTPYTLRWTADLLHYFQPTSIGGLLGEDVVADQVVFEVVAEKIFVNGSVKSSMTYQYLTHGPVYNTGEYNVTFPPVLLDMGDRFFINVKSINNSDSFGWSKSYFTLRAEQRPRSLDLSNTLPVVLPAKKTLSLSSRRVLFALPSVSAPRSKASRSLTTGCSSGSGKLTIELNGILALKTLTIARVIRVDLSSVRTLTFPIVASNTRCIATPTPQPTKAPPPPSTTPPPSASPIIPKPSTRRPTRSPAFIPLPVITTLNRRYSFSSIAVTDSIGGADGTLEGLNVKVQDTRGFGRAIFNGDNGSGVKLPARILEPTALSGATAFSIEMWFTTSSADTYSGYCPRLFQFGTAGTNENSVGVGRRDPCWLETGYINAFALGATDCSIFSDTPLNGAWNMHLVLTYALGGYVNLYLEGVLAMRCSGAISAYAYDTIVATETNYLGRSLWRGDVGLTGSIDEFRVWNGELSAVSV
jgi:Concanavalin A-like lectin/glucanases superfamily